MKKHQSILIFTMLFGAAATANNPVEDEKVPVKTGESKVTWKAYKVTGAHTGTVDLREGNLTFDQGTLKGGEFVVDMSSLIATDLEGEYKEKLEGHLKSEDFFAVSDHPTASLVFKSVKAKGKNAYEVTGDLTIKGITKPITFDVSVYGNKATATMKIDRAQYNVRYGSGSFFENLGDKAIYDEFDLIVDLEF